MKHLLLVLLPLSLIVLNACDKDVVNTTNRNSLANYIANKTVETGAVIACAGSDNNTNEVLIFYYPEDNANNYKFFETNTTEEDNSDFNNYHEIKQDSEPVFNGALRRFRRHLESEKWIIVSTELKNEIKLSNPIRIKHLSKPTTWQDIVSINHDAIGMPKFSWTDNYVKDNAIYFQVITNKQNDFLSGTYTIQNEFQYYKLDNVVLNVTKINPPILAPKTSYNFTLMDISVDNWVNLITLNKNISIP